MVGTRGAAFGAAAAVLLMFVVLGASAKIRAAGGGDVALERGVHRLAATAAAVAITGLAWSCRRDEPLRRIGWTAFALMVVLSVVGAIGGTAPPAWIAFVNQSGGIALTAMLAWLWARVHALGRVDDASRAIAVVAIVLGAAQCVTGAAVAAFVPEPGPLVLLAHAALGLSGAAVLAGTRRPLGYVAALAAPVLGILALVVDAPGVVPVAHALAAAAMLSTAAALHGGGAGGKA